MSKVLKFPVTDYIRAHLGFSNVPFGEHVSVLEDAYKKWEGMVRDQYRQLCQAEQHALTVLFCLTHPDHKQKHFEVNHPVASRKQKLVGVLNREDVATIGKWLFAVAVLVLLAAISAHAQKGTSRIDVITYQNQGSTIGVFAAPFKVNFTGAGVTCSRSGGTVTCTVTGGSITNNPGGSSTNVQYNNAGAFGGIGNGTVGQVLESNGAGSPPSFQDPIVSYNYVNLWTAQDVTVTRTSAVTRVSTFGAYGSLLMTWAGITGSPSTCTIQVKSADSAGNLINNGSALSVSPANGTTSQAFTPAATIPTHAQMAAVFACGTYPTAGTLTLDFVPSITTFVPNTVAISAASLPIPTGAALDSSLTTIDTDVKANITLHAGTNVIGHVIADSGSTTAVTGNVASTVADGADTTLGAKADAKSTATDTTAVSIMSVLKEISALEQAPASTPVTGTVTTTPPANASTNVAQVGGTNVSTGTGAGGAGIPRVTVSNDSTVGLVAGSALVGKVGIDQTTPGTTNGVQVNAALPAGTNLIGKAGFDNTTPGTTNAVSMYQPSRTTGTITTNASTITATSTGYGVATVTVNGTYAGVTVNFEFSDDAGTTYYADTCTRTDTNVQESSEVLPSNQTRAWDCGIYATTNFRVRSSAFTSGTANVGITLSGAPIEAAPTVSVSGNVPVTQSTSPWVDSCTAANCTVEMADGSANKFTSNSTTTSSKFGLDTNILSILGTAPTAAGKLDVKGADGDVFVRQATAANLNATVVGTLTDNNAAPAATNLGSLTGIARTDYRGGTAATAGRLVAPDVGTDGLLHVATLPDASLKRYRASSKFAASSTTDNWRISGNASNTVLVTKIAVTCTQTTAGMVSLVLRKESAAVSGGTAATVTNFPIDSNKGAASSVVQSFTGTGPTVGTLVGDIDDSQFGCMASGTATPNDIYITPTSLGAPVAVLRGVAEGVAINFGGAITGGNLTVSVEWTEVTTITP